MPEPTELLNIEEWRILQAFQSHQGRLECKAQYSPLGSIQQGLSSVEWGNASAFFDTGLRQLLTNPDLRVLVENNLQRQQENTKFHLQGLCALLDRAVNVDLWSAATQIPYSEREASLYPNFSSLLRLLNETTWTFDLATGRGHVLFRLNSKSKAVEADEVIRKFNDFFSRPLRLPSNEGLPRRQLAPELRGNEFRDRATTALAALFPHLPQQESQDCNGHEVLVKLPDWDSIDARNTELNPALEFFLSTCPDSSSWQSSHCYVQTSMDSPTGYEPCVLCDEITDARVLRSHLRLFAVDGNIYVPSENRNDANQHLLRPDDQPSITLHELVGSGNFLDMQTLSPLIRVNRRATQRFGRNHKRSLAARLALSLSIYLDSDYTLRTWDPEHIFFLQNSGQCERELVYVFTAATDKMNNIHLNESTEIYTDLARVLLEIEYGSSLQDLQLKELKEWVDDALFMSNSGSESDALDDMIDLRRMDARRNYLTAVRDLLNFKRTYNKGSRRLRGRSFDVGTIAREIIFVDIAEKIRSTIDTTHFMPAGFGGLRGAPHPHASATTIAPQLAAHGPMYSSINSTIQPVSYRPPQRSVIELFDELDESSQDHDKASKASYFFERLSKFHQSCVKRANQLCRTECVEHKRIRIAVLDTGVNKANGGIYGGFLLGRMKAGDCHSWVGSDPADVHDAHGHGTNVTNLLLQVAPWAEICVGKVFTGNEFSPEEAKNVAKAIRHAANVWNADIITMSFGLKSPSQQDEELKSAFRDIKDAIRESGSKIYFAAAANHGSHGLRTFPANDPAVICIHASDGKGKDGRISPDPDDADHNFMTLGISIPVVNADGTASRKSGTSYATPIAAALAAHILYVTECLMNLTPTARECLRTGEGMRKMLDLMCKPKGRDGYRFLAPWVELWKDNWHDDEVILRNAESTILGTELFRY